MYDYGKSYMIHYCAQFFFRVIYLATIVRGTEVPRGKLKVATASRTIPSGDSTVYSILRMNNYSW